MPQQHGIAACSRCWLSAAPSNFKRNDPWFRGTTLVVLVTMVMVVVIVVVMVGIMEGPTESASISHDVEKIIDFCECPNASRVK